MSDYVLFIVDGNGDYKNFCIKIYKEMEIKLNLEDGYILKTLKSYYRFQDKTDSDYFPYLIPLEIVELPISGEFVKPNTETYKDFLNLKNIDYRGRGKEEKSAGYKKYLESIINKYKIEFDQYKKEEENEERKIISDKQDGIKSVFDFKNFPKPQMTLLLRN
jgi:hypothetical protein